MSEEKLAEVEDIRDVDIQVVAGMLDCSTRSIRTWITENAMPHWKINGRLHFNLAKVNEWALIRRLKKEKIWEPIPPATQICEIEQFLKDEGFRYRLQEIEYDENGVEL